MLFDKFETRYPAPQNAIDIFAGKWASDVSRVCPTVAGTGAADLFVADPRPKLAAERLTGGKGRFDGMRILELGPLEGGHSFQMEQLGADHVLGIEANVEAFLKCLIVKELLNLQKCHFELGDVMEYMTKTQDRFDLVFCSGILYHMSDPLSLIKETCRITDRCFVWTHYYEAAAGDREGKRLRRTVSNGGFEAEYFELEYKNMEGGTFWGGNTTTRAWMSQDTILAGFRHFGLNKITMIEDTPSHPNGAAMIFVASRES